MTHPFSPTPEAGVATCRQHGLSTPTCLARIKLCHREHRHVTVWTD